MKQFFFHYVLVIVKKKIQTHTLTLLIILIVKILQIELHSTNLLLRPPICRNKRAIKDLPGFWVALCKTSDIS